MRVGPPRPPGATADAADGMELLGFRHQADRAQRRGHHRRNGGLRYARCRIPIRQPRRGLGGSRARVPRRVAGRPHPISRRNGRSGPLRPRPRHASRPVRQSLRRGLQRATRACQRRPRDPGRKHIRRLGGRLPEIRLVPSRRRPRHAGTGLHQDARRPAQHRPPNPLQHQPEQFGRLHRRRPLRLVRHRRHDACHNRSLSAVARPDAFTWALRSVPRRGGPRCPRRVHRRDPGRDVQPVTGPMPTCSSPASDGTNGPPATSRQCATTWR
jgi:hypothetical protein